MNFYIETFGCKVNQYDSQEMADRLAERGFIRLNEPSAADIIIVNSCTVTAQSDRKVKSALRGYKRDNPARTVVLAGCLPQSNPELREGFLEADIVIGNRNNGKIAEIITNYLNIRERVFDVTAHRKGDLFTGEGITAFEGHTRAFVKIQDGCDRFCGYCIIPASRGRSRSKDLSKVKDEMRVLAAAGYKEIVLVGINLSDYGKNAPYSLADAVLAAEDIDGIYRIRLGSLEPDHLTDEMLKRLSDSSKLCFHFHVSLQSGSEKILAAMNRHYTPQEYLKLCGKLRSTFPGCALTTDIMTGFPGETEYDFNKSIELAQNALFEKIHIFPYSKRAGTKAASAANQVPAAEKKRRAALLRDVAENLRDNAFRNQIGKRYEILLESLSDDGFEGYTDNYFPVKTQDNSHKNGELLNVVILGEKDGYLLGAKAEN